MIIAEITPIHSSLFASSLSYLSKQDLQPGDLVEIPLRKKNILGIVLSTSDARDFKQNIRKQNFTIKHINKKIDKKIFSQAYIKAMKKSSSYWHLSLGKCLDVLHSKKIRDSIEDFLFTEEAPLKQTPQEFFFMGTQKERIEHYLEMAHEYEKNIHIICPTNLCVQKTLKLLRQENKDIPVFALHSGSSAASIKKVFDQINNSKGIFVSTALFLDLIRENITHIILEEASSPYYTRAYWPEIDTKILAELYVQEKGINITWADDILNPKLFFTKKTSQIPNKKFFTKKSVTIINQKNQISKKTDMERIAEIEGKKEFQVIHPQIIEAIKSTLYKKEQVFCYVSKKNLASTIACQRCGSLVKDPETNNPYRLSVKTINGVTSSYFIEPQTNKHISPFDLCPLCDGRLQGFGIGTEKIYNLLSEKFPESSISIIDGNNNTKQKEIKNALQSDIIIGTLKAIPYIQDIQNQIIISLDSHFAHMNYDADFEVLRIIMQMHNASKENLLIQTRNIINKKIPILENGDYKKETLDEIKTIEEFNLPPKINTILIEHETKEQNKEELSIFYSRIFSKENPKIQFLHKEKKGILQTIFHVSHSDWNPLHQNQEIKEKLPEQNHLVKISINPKNIF